MTIAICPLCHNTGGVGDRYCTCEAALALRVRIDSDPQLIAARDRIDRMLAAQERPAVFALAPIDGRAVTGKPRPPWWRVLARRRWDRTVELAHRLRAEAILRGPQ